MPNGAINGAINNLSSEILQSIKSNKNITISELVEKTGKSRRTIQREIKNLREADVIKRIGSNKTGYWEILEKR